MRVWFIKVITIFLMVILLMLSFTLIIGKGFLIDNSTTVIDGESGITYDLVGDFNFYDDHELYDLFNDDYDIYFISVLVDGNVGGYFTLFVLPYSLNFPYGYYSLNDDNNKYIIEFDNDNLYITINDYQDVIIYVWGFSK